MIWFYFYTGGELFLSSFFQVIANLYLWVCDLQLWNQATYNLEDNKLM